MKLPRLNVAIAERLDDEDYPVQDAVDFLQDQLDSGVLEGINEGAVCVVRDGLYSRDTELETLQRVREVAIKAGWDPEGTMMLSDFFHIRLNP